MASALLLLLCTLLMWNLCNIYDSFDIFNLTAAARALWLKLGKRAVIFTKIVPRRKSHKLNKIQKSNSDSTFQTKLPKISYKIILLDGVHSNVQKF